MTVVPREPEPTLPAIGTLIDERFELLGTLGEGGMGHVFRVHDRRRGHEVALKLITPRYLGRAEREERFFREYELGTRAEHHRHLVEYLEVGRLGHGGWPYLVMTLVPGRDVALRLVHGALEAPEAVRAARQVAGALRALHRAGVVHRDVTTMNVLLCGGDAVLIDLSHAGEVAAPEPMKAQRRLTRDHEVPGTHYAMAPEQARAEPAHPAMDVYAFGVMLAHMLTGVVMGGAGREDFIRKQREGKLRPPRVDTRVYTTVPPALAELVDACTGLEPERRPTIDEVVQRLEELLVLMPAIAADSSGLEPAANEPSGPEFAAELGGVRAAVSEPSGPVVVAEAGRPGAVVREPRGASAAVLSVAAGVRVQPAEPSGGRSRPAGAAFVVLALLGVVGVLGILSVGRWGADEPEALEEPSTLVAEAPAAGRSEAEAPPRSGKPASVEPEGSAAQPEGSAKVEGPTEDPDPEEPEAKPGARVPAKRASPPAARRARSAHPEPSPPPDDQACAQTVTQAMQAMQARQWPRVLHLTRSRACWAKNPDRARFRIKAFSELGRYSECVALGKTVSDPEVNRQAIHCSKRVETETR